MVGTPLRAPQGAPLIELRRCATADELLALAGEFLAAREAEHNLVFGILGTIRRDPDAYGGGTPYLAVALRGGYVAGVAVRTPPWGPVLSELDEPALADAFADDFAMLTDDLAGVLGRKDAAARFAARWSRLTGASGRVVMEQRVHATASAAMPDGASGSGRRYAETDREVVLEGLDAFAAEALPDAPHDTSEPWLERRLSDPDGEILLWEDEGRPVSLAASGTPTPTGIRVGPVYTPLDCRRRGYAEAVTAEVTSRALARGRRFSFLFTDLANPTSNAIYQRIGYRPVCDVDQWAFTR